MELWLKLAELIRSIYLREKKEGGMSREAEQDELLFNVLNNLFKMVAIYSCERLKIQDDYPLLYLWFSKTMDSLIYPKFDEFLKTHQRESITSSQSKEMISKYNYQSIRYDVIQEFWIYAQKGSFQYSQVYFEKYSFTEKDLKVFFDDLNDELREARLDNPDADDYWDLAEKFQLASFLSKDTFNKSFFTYFALHYGLTAKFKIYDDEKILEKMMLLIEQIPYDSPFFKEVFSSKVIADQKQKKYVSTLTVPLSFEASTLMDNIFQFLFKLLQDSFLYAVDQNIKHPLGSFRKKSDLKSLIFTGNNQIRLHECITMMEILFKAVTAPKSKNRLNHYRIIIKGESLHRILISLLFKKFQQLRYRDEHDARIFEQSNGITSKLKKKLSKKEALNLYLEFIEFLEVGFKEHDITVNCNRNDKHIDDWIITLKFGSKELDRFTGNQLRANFKNHSKLFKFSISQNDLRNYVVPIKP